MKRAQVLVDRYRQIRASIEQRLVSPDNLQPLAIRLAGDTVSLARRTKRHHSLAFRREQAEKPVLYVSLRGLERNRNYQLAWQGTATTEQVRGSVLMDGFPVRLDHRRSSAVILYSRHP